MLNETILQTLADQQEPIYQGIDILIKSSFGYFIQHPFIFGGAFILIVLAIGTLMSIWFDRAEGRGQEFVWSTTVYVVVFFVMFFLLILVDTGEAFLLTKLF